MPDIARPSELAELADLPRSASYVDEDLFYYGSFYDKALPSQLVNAVGTRVDFAGFWAEGQGTEGLPYCIYEFQATDYDREPEIHYEWHEPPTDIGNAYIGLSKWDGDHWAWFQCSAADYISVGSMDDYINQDGLLLLVVAVANHERSQLSWVNLGPPNVVAKLDADPGRGVTPLTVSLSGSRSICTLGEITKYEWDVDGDGTYDINSGTDPSVDHIYSFDAEFNPVLKVTNSFGVESTASTPVTTTYPWSTSWGKVDAEEFFAIDVDGDEFVYCGGLTRSYGAGHNDALLVKYAMDGTLLWAKCWGGAGSDVIMGIDVADNGSVCVVGSTYSFGEGQSDIFVQLWDASGNLVWTNSWGRGGYDSGAAIAYFPWGLDGDIYVTGSSVGAGIGADDGVLLKFNEGGSMVYAKYFGWNFNDEGSAISLRKPLAGPLEIHVAGRLSLSDTDHRQAHMRFASGGDLDWGYTYDGMPFNGAVNDMAYTGGLTTGSWWLTGWVSSGGGGKKGFLLEHPDTGDPLARRYWEDLAASTEITGIISWGNSFVLAGYTEGIGAYQRAMLLSCGTDGVVDAGKVPTGASADSRFNAICRFPVADVLAAGAVDASNSVTWQSYLPNQEAVIGTWTLAPVSSGDADGTLNLLTGMGDISDITTAVIDSGGGDSDAYAVATKAP